MRRFSGKAALVIGGTLLACVLVADSVASTYSLTSYVARPILALSRDGLRIPVSPLGTPGQPGQATIIGGTGILLGQAMTYALPDGTTVSCRLRLTYLRCDPPWQAERAASQ